MRFARKMLLLVVAATAVMALAAPSASAVVPIEVTKAKAVDGTYPHCPAIVPGKPNPDPTPDVAPSGGCAVHAEGEITLFFHIFGFEGAEAKCHVEFRGLTDENGGGFITAQTVTPGKHDADCTNATSPPCDAEFAINGWKGSAEKDADGVVRAHYTVCTDPAESGTCSGEFIATVTESGTTTETQTQTATDITVGGSFCELTVTETSEAVTHAGPPVVVEGEATHIKSINP